MADADAKYPVCANCGLPFRADETRIKSWEDPPRYIHDTSRCIGRLTAELDSACAERAAAHRVALRLRGELDDAQDDLAAALRVVRAARLVRVREWQEERAEKRAPDGWDATVIAACNATCAARVELRAATVAYLRGEGR